MTYVHEATVEGMGAFPVDMLRYDGCHPTSAESVAVIERQAAVRPPREPWKVDLAAMSQSKAPLWTKARWKSFGVVVTKTSVHKV